MALYTNIKGNDVFILLGEAKTASTLMINNQSSDSPYWHFVMTGQPAIGDKVTLHLQDTPMNVFDQVFTAATTNLQDLLDLISAAVNESDYFSAANANGSTWGVEGIGLDFTSKIGAAVFGDVSVSPFVAVPQVVACTKSDVFNLENELLEITEIDIKNTNYIPTFQGATMSIEQSIVADVASGKLGTTQIEDWAFAQTKLNFVFQRPDGAYTRTISGSCYVKSSSIQGGVNTGGLANFELVCVGEIIPVNTLNTTPLATPEIGASSFYATIIYFAFSGDGNTESFVLERALNPGFTTGLTTVYTGAGPTANDSGLTANTTYYYRIKATSSDPVFSDSDYAYITRTTLLGKLAAPTGLIVSDMSTPGRFTVLWDTVPNATYYSITDYTDPGLTNIYNGWNPSQVGTGQQSFTSLYAPIAAGNYYLTINAGTSGPQTWEDSDATPYTFNPIAII